MLRLRNSTLFQQAFTNPSPQTAVSTTKIRKDQDLDA